MNPSIKIAAALVGVAALVGLGILALSDRQSSEEGPQAQGESSPKAETGFTAVDPPKPLPTLKLTDGDGHPASLGQFAGKVVLVNFWATWCVPCVKEMPALSRLQARLGDKDFVVVAVSGDRKGPDVVRPFLKDHGVTNLTVLYDPMLASARMLNLAGLPTSLLLDRKGREIGVVLGGLDWKSDSATRRIDQALAAHDAPDS